jgi:hypothetical protein
MRAILIAGVFVLFAGSAEAQRPTRTPEEVAAYAQQVIAAAQAQDFFAIEPAPPPAAYVRHLPSNMLCIFAIGFSSEITMTTGDAQSAARGDDVTCTEHTDRYSISTRAARHGTTDLNAAIDDAASALRRDHPEAREIPISSLALMPMRPPRAPPPSQTVAYAITVDGAPRFIRISMYANDSWTYTLTFNADDPGLNPIPDYAWTGLLLDLQNHAAAAK